MIVNYPQRLFIEYFDKYQQSKSKLCMTTVIKHLTDSEPSSKQKDSNKHKPETDASELTLKQNESKKPKPGTDATESETMKE